MSKSRNLRNYFTEWDRGLVKSRGDTLSEFIKESKDLTAPELEQEFDLGASLFLARIISWLRLSYLSDKSHLSLQLKSIAIFVSAANGTSFAMTQYYFSMGLIDDNFTTAFTSLNKLDGASFSEFLQLIIIFLSNPNEAQDFLVKLEKYAANLNIQTSTIQLIAKAVLLFFRGCLQRSLSVTQIAEDLANLGLNDERIKLLSQNWGHSFTAISNVNQQRVLTIHQLSDLEWRFGITTGNSLISRVGKIFLQMKFKLITGEIICIEMSLEQFYSFLHEMEKARASIEYLI